MNFVPDRRRFDVVPPGVDWDALRVTLEAVATAMAGRLGPSREGPSGPCPSCAGERSKVALHARSGFGDADVAALSGSAPACPACRDLAAVARVVRPSGLRPRVAGSQHAGPTLDVAGEAEGFLVQHRLEAGGDGDVAARIGEVRRSIAGTATWTPTASELSFGAKVAWRNSTRCIGRIFWKSLAVRDRREVRDPEGIFEAVVEHVRWATNGGDLRSAITVFAPAAPDREGVRIVNAQLILYAGYRRGDGSVLGDPRNVELTPLAEGLGWRGEGIRFDVLPLIVREEGGRMTAFVLPLDAVLEVGLSHPDVAAFAGLGLRWYALPAVSSMALDVGGVRFPLRALERRVHGHRDRQPRPRRPAPLRRPPGGRRGARHRGLAARPAVARPRAGRAQPRRAALLRGGRRVRLRPPPHVRPLHALQGAGRRPAGARSTGTGRGSSRRSRATSRPSGTSAA